MMRADWLKSLSNSIECPIIAAGLPLTTDVIAKNVQLERRVVGAIELPRFAFDTSQDQKKFYTLVALFASKLPFENPEFFTQDDVARALHALSEGVIGRLARFFRLIAECALSAGDKRISQKHYELAVIELSRFAGDNGLVHRASMTRKRLP